MFLACGIFGGQPSSLSTALVFMILGTFFYRQHNVKYYLAVRFLHPLPLSDVDGSVHRRSLQPSARMSLIASANIGPLRRSSFQWADRKSVV